MANIAATQTSQPDVQVSYKKRKRLTDGDWQDLAINVETSAEAALGDRETLDQNLKEWNETYEMLAGEKDWPWANSSNLITPLLVTQFDSLLAYVASQVLVPKRLFLVSGNTTNAQQTANQVERYYNNELVKQRETTGIGADTWMEELYDWLAIALRDGTGIMECVWKYREVKTKVFDKRPLMDAQTGGQQVGLDAMPMYETVPSEMVDLYNDVNWESIELRNFYTIPAACMSIRDARAVVKIEYLYEDQLQEMIEEGLLDPEETELALCMVPNGATELTSSQQPTETYTAGKQINLGSGQGTQSTKFFRNRGPIEVHRMHTNQYDLDLDGKPEENIIWWHYSTKRILGWMRYEYFAGVRPFFAFSPFPRFKRLYGFSLIERLQGLQNEEDALRNQRIDEGDVRLGGLWLYTAGAVDKEKLEFGPTSMNEVNAEAVGGDLSKVVQRVDFGPMPTYSYLESDKIKQDAQEFTGLSNPMVGQQQSGRRSAQEAKQWAAAAATRTGLLAMRFRMAIRPLINFTHKLKQQYLTSDQTFSDNNERFELPLPVLQQDYSLDVAGSSDPIDANTRRAETLAAVNEFMQFPLFQQDPMKQYYLLRKALESMGPQWAVDVDKLLGTEQQMQQQVQQMQAQAQMAAQAGMPPPGAEGGQQHGGKPHGGRPGGPAGDTRTPLMGAPGA